MADLQKTVEILFTGKSDIDKAISRVETQVNGFARSLEDVADPFASITESVLATEAALAALVAGGMALALNASGDFNDSFAEISTLVDASAESIDKFKLDLLDYSSRSTAAFDDVNASVYSAISAGTDYRESLSLIEKAEKLSIAGRAGLNETTVLLASTLNAYGESADEAARYSDILFQTVKLGQTTIPELAARLSQVTGIASSAGISFETLTSAIAALTAAGLPTAEAITAIKAAISNIIKPSSEAQQIAQKLGLSFDATALQTRGFEGVLEDVRQSTGGNVETMAKLFGSVEGLNAVLTLTGNGAEKFADAMESMEKSAGSVEIAYGKMVDNFAIVNNQLLNAVKGSLVAVGSELEAGYADIGSGISALFLAIKSAVQEGALDPLFQAFENFGSNTESYFKDIAQSLPEALAGVDFSSLVRSLSSLSDALKDLFSGVDLDTPERLQEAIQGLIDIISGFINATAGFVDAFQPFFNAISQALVHLGEMDEQGQKTLGEIGALAEGISLFGAKVAAAFVVLGQSAETMGAAWDIVDGAIRTWWNGLEITIGAIAQGVIGLLAEIVGAYNEFANNLGLDGFPNLEKNLNELSNELFAGIGQDAIDANKGLNIMTDGMAALAFHALNSSDDVAKFGDTVKKTASDLPVIETEVTVTGTESYVAKLAQAIEKADLLPEKKETLSLVRSDGSIVTVSKEIEKTIPKEITAKVKLESDEVQIERIKGQFETIQELAKFSMEIETARIKADAAQVEATFASISETMQSSGSVVSSLIGEYSKAWGSTKADIGWWIDEELDLRKEAVRLQAEMVDAQRKYMEARTQSMSKGESLISVTATGLEPELEAFMWKIIERVQIRVAEEQREFLLGI